MDQTQSVNVSDNMGDVSSSEKHLLTWLAAVNTFHGSVQGRVLVFIQTALTLTIENVRNLTTHLQHVNLVVVIVTVTSSRATVITVQVVA